MQNPLSSRKGGLLKGSPRENRDPLKSLTAQGPVCHLLFGSVHVKPTEKKTRLFVSRGADDR